jgi:hypothetical protein
MRLRDTDLYDDDFDEDEYEDDDDDDDDDICTDDDEDIFESLEYADTNQIQTRREIVDDIKMYLRKYQPMYKIIRRKNS